MRKIIFYVPGNATQLERKCSLAFSLREVSDFCKWIMYIVNIKQVRSGGTLILIGVFNGQENIGNKNKAFEVNILLVVLNRFEYFT